MPTDLPIHDDGEPDARLAQASLLTDALATDDALFVSRALHDVAAAQGQRYGFGDDPALSVVLAAIAALGLDLTAKPRE